VIFSQDESTPQSNGTTVLTDFTDTGEHAKTFLTAGGIEPGDKQTLRITRCVDRENVVKSPHAETIVEPNEENIVLNSQAGSKSPLKKCELVHIVQN
jgi:hypothetical protein